MQLINVDNIDLGKIFFIHPYKVDDYLKCDLKYDDNEFLIKIPSTYVTPIDDDNIKISLIGYRSNEKLNNFIRFIEDIEDYIIKSSHFSYCNIKLESMINKDSHNHKYLIGEISNDTKYNLSKKTEKNNLVKMAGKLSVLVFKEKLKLHLDIKECLIY